MKNTVVILMILGGALSRLIPHTPNFTAVTAIALLGGAFLSSRRLAVVVPLTALLISDLILGMQGHVTILFVYGSIGLIALASSFVLKGPFRVLNLIGSSLGASLFFFFVTNFGVWLMTAFYPQTWDGLVTCYITALPYLGYQFGGDLFYSAVLFGALLAIRAWKPELLSKAN